MKRNVWIARLAIICLLQGLCVFAHAAINQEFQQRVNLALRQTGHRLLLAQEKSSRMSGMKTPIISLFAFAFFNKVVLSSFCKSSCFIDI